jgi:ribosomal protein S18 acetylase RimI-like enzyme
MQSGVRYPLKMMAEVAFTEDPAFVLKRAGKFLASQPVLHNLVLSLLHARIVHPEPGRYWLVEEGQEVAGVVLQSPLTFAATFTPMDARATEAVVGAIAEAGIRLPGVNGDAATAARFAGLWSERRRSAATPFQGSRLYERLDPGESSAVEGQLRPARAGDRSLLVDWTRGFQIEIGEAADDAELRVDRELAAGELWLWEDGEPMSMAMSRKPVEGVVRISGVYTPANNRRRSYATACARALSNRMRDAGFRCVLYTDLANPTSNSIYCRIGYRAVAEGLRYRFG